MSSLTLTLLLLFANYGLSSLISWNSYSGIGESSDLYPNPMKGYLKRTSRQFFQLDSNHDGVWTPQEAWEQLDKDKNDVDFKEFYAFEVDKG